MENIDKKTVSSFGSEWATYDQHSLDNQEAQEIFSSYFSLVPPNFLSDSTVAVDVGCGSGRWAKQLAASVGRLILVDPAAPALEVARNALASRSNCEFRCESVGAIGLPEESADLVYSLGVLHHIPDTQAGINECVRLLKPRGAFLVYLYYKMENRPRWYKVLWRCSEVIRGSISRLPVRLRRVITDPIALFVYWPLARLARLATRVTGRQLNLPLAFYRDKSFYVMRTDALDRFGTPLEKRFTRNEIESMLTKAGLARIQFREDEPYWCAIGFKPGR